MSECERTTSKIILYFVSIFTSLFGLLNGVVLIVYCASHFFAQIVITVIALCLGQLLLAGLIKKSRKLIETYVFISTSLLILGTIGLVFFIVAFFKFVPDHVQLLILWSIKLLAFFWVMQLAVFWAYLHMNCLSSNTQEDKIQRQEMPEI